LPEFLKLNISSCLGLKKYLKERYPNYISSSSRPHKPNINLDAFIEEINREKPEMLLSELIEWIESENTKHYNYLLETKNELCLNLLTKIDATTKTRNGPKFYLGCFWLEPIPNKILSVTRKKCWDAWYQKNFQEGLHYGDKAPCFVCEEMISRDNFEAGHIKSHKNGGDNRLENLKPVCSKCNKRVGTKNMMEFKESI
jgi:hypothetical protein